MKWTALLFLKTKKTAIPEEAIQTNRAANAKRRAKSTKKRRKD